MSEDLHVLLDFKGDQSRCQSKLPKTKKKHQIKKNNKFVN